MQDYLLYRMLVTSVCLPICSNIHQNTISVLKIAEIYSVVLKLLSCCKSPVNDFFTLVIEILLQDKM